MSFANGKGIKEVYTYEVYLKKMHMYNKQVIISDPTLTTTNLKNGCRYQNSLISHKIYDVLI